MMLVYGVVISGGARESANIGRKEKPATPKTPVYLLHRTRFQFEKTPKYTCPHTLPAEVTHVAARSGGPAVVNPKASTGLRTASSMEAAASAAASLASSAFPCRLASRTKVIHRFPPR